ncbi:hypothetical protein X777_04553 [Ooceraea biroi]|uniref:Uncharacterized protein n=1 Tax=Ooceraea biroi TaxID=2015173 RepID=A0A026WHE7_OOCBI|nr:hypothetical protein X777_04553 [Ooceraea biroi]
MQDTTCGRIKCGRYLLGGCVFSSERKGTSKKPKVNERTIIFTYLFVSLLCFTAYSAFDTPVQHIT